MCLQQTLLKITLVSCWLLVFSFTASAELVVIEDAEDQQGLTVHRMTVTAAPEPVPALKHRFRVPLHLRKPGNAAIYYLRSLGESSGPGLRWRRLSEKYGEEIYDWYEYDFPTEQIPKDKFREVANDFHSYIDNYIREASLRRECDWGLEEMDLRGPEAVAFLLPDVQESRGTSRALALLTKQSIFDSNYEQALDYIRINYQLGQDISKQRFLVCSLVGMAEVGLANKSVIELISSEDSPNLYWALTELPRPIIDIREAMNLDMSLGLRMFPALLDVETKEHDSAEWSRLLAATIQDFNSSLDLFGRSQFPKDKTLVQLAATGLSLVVYPTAKQRLIDAGMSTAKVDTMPVAQVLLVDAAREFQKVADDYEKWTFVPYRQIQNVEIQDFKVSNGFGRMLANQILPAVNAARTAQMRIQWQMNAIRAIEALRMHAAETGELPASLAEVKVVPVPENPITRKPFLYRLEGKRAVLELPFSDGMPGLAWRFEIQLAAE